MTGGRVQLRESVFTAAEIAEMERKFPDYRRPCEVCGERPHCWCAACFPPKGYSDMHTWECHQCRVERTGTHQHAYRYCACGAKKP